MCTHSRLFMQGEQAKIYIMKYKSDTQYGRDFLIAADIRLARQAKSEDETKKHLAVAWGAQLRHPTLTHADRINLTVDAYGLGAELLHDDRYRETAQN